MDGVFMKKLLKSLGVCLLLAVFVWMGMVFADRRRLSRELIRFHVVAASDSEQDQNTKLLVRDAVIAYLQDAVGECEDMEDATKYLSEQIPTITSIANEVLEECGSNDVAVASLEMEAFPTREYDTFTLPAGVYHSLRITIGDGDGKNWWCVVFPTLCVGATAEDFEEIAAGSGFPESLTETLQQKDGYKVRFYLLDLLGNLENIFCCG